MKNLYIFCGGDIARETIKLVEQINNSKKKWIIKGIIDNNLYKKKKYLLGIKIYKENLFKPIKNSFAICAISNPFKKKMLMKKIKSYGLKIATLCSPNNYYYKDSKIGEGSIIFSNSQIGHNTYLGKNVLISFGSDIGHNIKIGDYCSILPCVTIAGYTRIGSSCLFGAGVNVMPKIKIGENCLLGIGSTVMTNIKKNSSVINGSKNIIMIRKIF